MEEEEKILLSKTATDFAESAKTFEKVAKEEKTNIHIKSAYASIAQIFRIRSKILETLAK